MVDNKKVFCAIFLVLILNLIIAYGFIFLEKFLAREVGVDLFYNPQWISTWQKVSWFLIFFSLFISFFSSRLKRHQAYTKKELPRAARNLILLTAGLMLFLASAPIYWMISYREHAQSIADPYSGTPAEIAFAFAYRLQNSDFEDVLSYSDTEVDYTQPDYYSSEYSRSEAKGLIKDSMEVPRSCYLLTSSASEVEVVDEGNFYKALLNYSCPEGKLAKPIYLRDSSWETTNSHLPIMVITPAAARAGQPIA